MLKNLFNSSYERNIHEAFFFYFIYLFILGYIFIGVALTTSGLNDITILTPSVFCFWVSMQIVIKKGLIKDSPSQVLVVLSFALSLFPGFFIGLIPVTILTTREDKSAAPELEINRKRRIERALEIEKELENDRKIEQEREIEREKELENQLEKDREINRKRKLELEIKREIEVEIDRKRKIELEIERDRQTKMEIERVMKIKPEE